MPMSSWEGVAGYPCAVCGGRNREGSNAMRSTHYAVLLHKLADKLYRSAESFAQQLDAKQFPLAGVELGRMLQIGSLIGELYGPATEALWEDSQAQ